MLNYTFSKSIGDCIYSIDMLYIRGYLKESVSSAVSWCELHCDTNKTYKGRCSYSWFQHVFTLNEVTLYIGLFDNFDKVSRKWDVVPMIEIRFNPNKYPNSDYLDYFLEYSDARYIRKFDFACDIPCEPKFILCKSNRTFSSISNGECRYYGAFGSDKHIKIYDKQKELLDKYKECLDSPLTRIELTMLSSGMDNFIREEFFRLDEINTDFDQIDGLNDTDIAILNLFIRLRAYEPNTALEDLRLGRKKEKKIRDALLSSSPSSSVGFSLEILNYLLDLVSVRLDCTIKAINKQLLTETQEDLPLSPF